MVVASAFCNATYSNTPDYRFTDSLVRVAANSDGLSRLSLYDTIASIHSNADSVLKYATLEFEMAQKMNQPTYRANAFRHIGMAHSYKWNIDKAYENMTQALEMYSSLDDTLNEAQCCDWLGRLLWMRSANANAVGFLNRSLELYKRLGREDLIAGIYRLMGLQCLDYKIYDRAYEYFGQALGIDKRIGCRSGEAEDHYCLGQGQLYQCIDEEGSLSNISINFRKCKS